MASALQGLSAVGAVLHVGGSLLIVLGQTVVKISHCIKETSGTPHTWLVHRHASPRPQWQRPDGQWQRLLVGSRAYAVGGWSLFAGGNLMRFVSMRFASQTVLSGLGSLQFVLIPIVSHLLLGIKADQSTALGVVTVVVGNIFIVWYGPSDVDFSMAELRQLWQTPTMRAFLLIMAVLLAGLQLDSIGFALPWTGTWVTADAAQVFTGALLYSAVASMLGAWSVLFSKSLTYVVSALPESATDPYSWFVSAMFLATAAFWIRQSNQGLRLYPASLIMPLMQAFWMCMSVLEGGIYFQELDHLSLQSLWLLMIGLNMALLGAIFMGVAGFVAERRLVAELDQELSCTGVKSSFALGSGQEMAELVGADQAYARRADTLTTPQLRAAAVRSDDLFTFGHHGIGNAPVPSPVALSRSQTLEDAPLTEGEAMELALSPRNTLASPVSPSSIREVVIDSQRLLRSGAGGLLHRVTQAFH